MAKRRLCSTYCLGLMLLTLVFLPSPNFGSAAARPPLSPSATTQPDPSGIDTPPSANPLPSGRVDAFLIGEPALTDFWVDPNLGNDTATGASRGEALRSLNEAWGRIPQSVELEATGYRLMLSAGDYAESDIPAWMESRYGTPSCPVIIESADGPQQARLHGYLDIFDCRSLYLIGLDLGTDPGYGGGGNVIHLASCSQVLLRSLRLDGFDGTTRQPQETLKANQCQGLYVEDCHISGAFWFALDFVAVCGGHILDSTIQDAGEDALLLKGGTSGLTVAGNHIGTAGRSGIACGDGTGFDYMVAPWLHYEIYDTKVINNLVHDTGNAGLAARGGYNILVAYNTFYRVGGNPIGVNLLEVALGIRGCEQAAPCLERHALGGWGPTTPGTEGAWVPNRHVYIYNNVLYNPAPFQTVYQHFFFAGPADPPLGTNIPSPALADQDLRIGGNLIWNGPADHPLGIGEGSGCQPDNLTCNESLLLSQNSINLFEPQLVDPHEGDFYPLPGGNVATATVYDIPDFPGGDGAQPPLAPPGDLSNAVTLDHEGHLRSNGNTPGAWLPGLGRAFYVAPGGSDANPGTITAPWANPGYASRRLAPGDTLILRGGRYPLSRFDEDILAPPDGTPTAWVTIRGETGTRPVLAGRDNLYSAFLLSNYLQVENLEITSDGGALFRSGVVGSSRPLNHIILEDLYVHHIDEGALDIRDVDNMQVLNCVFTYCGFGGIGGPAATAGGVRNLLVGGCELSYAGHYYQGIIDNPANPYDRPDGFGIEPSEGPIEIRRTTSAHNRGDGLDSKAAQTTIESCIVANNSCDGVKLWGHDSAIRNTLIYGTGDGTGGGSPWAGIVINEISKPGAHFEISNVTLEDNPTRYAYPIYAQYGQSNPIHLDLRNTIVAGGYGLAYFGDSVELVAANNLFYRPGEAAQVYANSREWSSAEVEGGAIGPGNLCRNPLFVHSAWAGEGDYRLRDGSPAIDTGAAANVPAVDLAGTARPQGAGFDIGAYERAPASSLDPSAPASPQRLVFVHHSTGENWLADWNGGLGIALRDNSYFVSDTNYGWGPGGIGDRTDIGNWWEWFRGPQSGTILADLYTEDGKNCSYSRLATNPDPTGENKIVLFKSCFPNSALKGNLTDPTPPIGSNPLRGQDSSSPYHTVANAKGIYLDLLNYFVTRPDKLFIVIAAPPLSNSTWAANARALNQWLCNDWLAGYPGNNVFVFDFYNVLTTNGGAPDNNDLGWTTGNHHRLWNGTVQHKTDGGSDILAYPSPGGDDHPSQAGNLKATAEYLPLLNIAYHRWQEGTPSLAILGLAATPSLDVAQWAPMTLTASSIAGGTWSVRLLNPLGQEVTSYGGLTWMAPNPGTALGVRWTPASYYSLTGTHQAVVILSSGSASVTATVPFSVYNFPMKIQTVRYWNASWVEIPNPTAGQSFFTELFAQNVSPTTVPLAFLPAMIGTGYIGAGGISNVFPGQSSSIFIQSLIAQSGIFTVQAFAWSGPGGTPLAAPKICSVNVLPP